MQLPISIKDVLKKLPQRPDPVRDWLTLLAVTVVILCVVVVGNARLFDTVANGGSIAAPSASSTPAFDQSMLQNVQMLFAERAAQEQKYASATLQFADPSQ